MFGNEVSCLELSINQEELIKIIRSLINELHVLDSESFDQKRLNKTILRLIEKSPDFKLRLNNSDNSLVFYQLDLSRNSRFLNIFLDNPKYIDFPEIESDKQKLIGDILDNFLFANYSKPTDIYKDVLKKQINFFLNVMMVEKKDIEKIIKEKNYERFKEKAEAFVGVLEKILTSELNEDNSQKAGETLGHIFLRVGSFDRHVEENSISEKSFKKEREDFCKKIKTIFTNEIELEFLEEVTNKYGEKEELSESYIQVLGMVYEAVPADRKEEIQQEIQRIFNVDITKDDKKKKL